MESPVPPPVGSPTNLAIRCSNPYAPGSRLRQYILCPPRSRFLASFLYQLPFGKGRQLLNSNAMLDRVIGGWELSGVMLFQSGPFLSASVLSDPSGTGYNIFGKLINRRSRRHGTGSRSLHGPIHCPVHQSERLHRSMRELRDQRHTGVTNAIGRFGDSSSGSIVGPGTQAVSLSLIKRFTIKERLRAEVGMQVANAFNHANYAPPNVLETGVSGFGQLTAMQSAEGAGPRQLQLTGRITF